MRRVASAAVVPGAALALSAQQRFASAEGTEARAMGNMRHVPTPTNRVTFPFVFPESGVYRVFVQVKVGGAVETAAFDVDVRES